MTDWAHQIRAVAFDMDGLMVNTEELYTVVCDIILQRRSRTFTRELKNAMMGLPGNQAWQMMIDSEKLADSVEDLDTEAKTAFETLLPQRLDVMPGLLDLLDLLERLELPRCVATSSTRYFANMVLTQVDVLSRLDFVITAEDVESGKPAPDIYLAAAERMGVSAEATLVLEDSHHGTRAGIRSGACTVAVPGEHSRDHDFSGVHRVATSLADPLIAELVERSSH